MIQEEPSCSYLVVESQRQSTRQATPRTRRRGGGGGGTALSACALSAYLPPSPQSSRSSGTTEHPNSQPSTSYDGEEDLEAQRRRKTAGDSSGEKGTQLGQEAAAEVRGLASTRDPAAVIQSFLDLMEQKQEAGRASAAAKYNFDFEACQPLPGGKIKWTKAKA